MAIPLVNAFDRCFDEYGIIFRSNNQFDPGTIEAKAAELMEQFRKVGAYLQTHRDQQLQDKIECRYRSFYTAEAYRNNELKRQKDLALKASERASESKSDCVERARPLPVGPAEPVIAFHVFKPRTEPVAAAAPAAEQLTAPLALGVEPSTLTFGALRTQFLTAIEEFDMLFKNRDNSPLGPILIRQTLVDKGVQINQIYEGISPDKMTAEFEQTYEQFRIKFDQLLAEPAPVLPADFGRIAPPIERRGLRDRVINLTTVCTLIGAAGLLTSIYLTKNVNPVLYAAGLDAMLIVAKKTYDFITNKCCQKNNVCDECKND